MKQPLFIINVLLLIAIFFLKPSYLSSNINASFISTILIIVLVAIFNHFIILKGGNSARFDSFFILGFFVVNFQWSMMIAFSGIDLSVISRFFEKSNYMNYSTWLAGLTILVWLLSFQLTYLVLRTSRKSSGDIAFSMDYESNKLRRDYIISRWCIWLAIIFLFLFILSVGPAFLSGVYRGTANWEGPSAYIYTLMHSFCLLSLGLYIYVRSCEKEVPVGILKFALQTPKLYLIFFCSYALFFLMLGDRGPAISLVLLALVFYGSFISNVSAPKLLVIAMVGLLVVMIIGKGRNSGGNVISSGIENTQVDSAYDATMELATSARTVLYSIEDVEKNGTTNGQTMINNLLGVIPLSQMIFLKLFDMQPMDISSSTYLTYRVKGRFDKGGVGTSYIADLYLSFGLLGVILMTMFHGWYCSLITYFLKKNKSTIKVILFIALASSSVYLARDAFLGPLRPSIWLLVIYFFLYLTYNSIYSRKRSLQ